MFYQFVFVFIKKSSDPNGILGLLQNQKYLGGILLAAGFLLSLMGIMLFFEGNLLRIGNVSVNNLFIVAKNGAFETCYLHVDMFHSRNISTHWPEQSQWLFSKRK